jgi:hypothetical protein
MTMKKIMARRKSVCLAAVALTLLLASWPASAAPLTDSERSTTITVITKDCIKNLIRDSDKIRDYFRMPAPLTEQEISDYCKCSASSTADVLTTEEYNMPFNKGNELPANMRDNLKCIVMEKCKKHLNLPDPSQFQNEECWKG